MSFRVPPALQRPAPRPRAEVDPMPEHFCHARGCARPVPAQMLMCARHWRLVPREIQTLLYKHWAAYRSARPNPDREQPLEVTAAIATVIAARSAWPSRRD